MTVSIIVATSVNGVIGNKNTLPWHYPEDLKYFKQQTTGKAIIMGRKTFDSIGRALPNRQNIVVTSSPDLYKVSGVEFTNSIQNALNLAKSSEVFIIGGSQIYAQALPFTHKIYRTLIQKEYLGDTYFTFPEDQFTLVQNETSAAEDGTVLNFQVYNRLTIA